MRKKQRRQLLQVGQHLDLSYLVISQVDAAELVVCRSQVLQVRDFVPAEVEVELVQRVQVLR